MSDLLTLVKPQLEALNQMYKAGYDTGFAEGRRQAQVEFAKDLQRIQDNAKKENP